MLDNISGGRMDIGVGRGGVIEAYFWGQDSDVEVNYARYVETLAVVKEGLANDSLTYRGEFYNFDDLPMRLRPKQAPYPPLWYMRNVETAAGPRDAHHHRGQPGFLPRPTWNATSSFGTSIRGRAR